MFSFIKATTCAAHLWLGMLAVLVGSATASANERPNFVLCMADDQGWGDVHYNNNDRIITPVLDEMAATGLRFDRFYAAAPVCSPTRGSVLTGRHPNRFGCFLWGYTLRPQETTFAEVLSKAGYATGHFGKWHLGSVQANSPVSPGNSGFETWLSSPNFYENDPWMSREGRPIQTKGESSMVAMDAAIDFIDKAAAEKRSFAAVVWFGSPHTPHIASDEIKALYPDETPKQQNYLGEITGIDQAMGKLRKHLRDANLADNTIIWYTSDNGARPEGSVGGLRGYKGQIWEGGLRVPAIIEWPARIRKNRRIDLPANTIDIFPTVLELAGVDYESKVPLDGVSLADWVDATPEMREKPFGFWSFNAGGRGVKSSMILQKLAAAMKTGETPPAPDANADEIKRQYAYDEVGGHSAWMDGDWKLHHLPSKKGPPQWRLYNLSTDPKEQNDLAEKEPERVKAMTAAHQQWIRSVVDSLNGKDY